jgi:hypothetical protein
MKHKDIVCIELLFRVGYLADSFRLNSTLNDETLSVDYTIDLVKSDTTKHIYVVYEPDSEPCDVTVPEQYTDYDAVFIVWHEYCAILNMNKAKKVTASSLFKLSDIEGLMVKYPFMYE